jgi:hypothetical protein
MANGVIQASFEQFGWVIATRKGGLAEWVSQWWCNEKMSVVG